MSNINKILAKASWPVFGNLSRKIQYKIQRKHLDFSGYHGNPTATKVSSFTNLLVAYNANKILNLLPAEILSSLPSDFSQTFFAYTLFESIYRYYKATDRETIFGRYELGEPTGSLIGKMISLPLEAYLYWKDDLSEHQRQKITGKLGLRRRENETN